jgi:anti-sigma factor RsiW
MKSLDLNELEALLDAHGAAPRRWPPSQRQAALELIARDAAAARMHAAAEELDADLTALPQPTLPAQLIERILATAPRRLGWRAALRQLWQDLGGLRLAGPVLACGLMAGMTWPMLDAQSPLGSEDPDLISVAQLGEEQWDINDLEIEP